MSEQNTMDIQFKLAELSAALLAANPEMPVLLAKIHAALKADPEQVTLLSEEDIALVVQGLSKHTGVSLTAAAKAPKAPSAKSRLDAILKASNLSAEDF